MNRTATAALTYHDRRAIAEAIELAEVAGAGFREYMAEADADLARAVALGRAQVMLAELAVIANRLAGAE